MTPIAPLARQLNDTLLSQSHYVYEMLSCLGQEIYFPTEGILSQSAEAKRLAKTYDATIGIALEDGQPMHVDVIQQTLAAYGTKDLYPYAPPAGKPELRKAWRNKILNDTPSLGTSQYSDPIVTNALTHGLSLVADLFVDEGDFIVCPDKKWENYDLIFTIHRRAQEVTYPLFGEDMTFNSDGLLQALLSCKNNGKAIVLLNFPNNPTGYTPGIAEAERIVGAIKTAAEAGINIVVVLDDAYFGLFFEDCIKQSLFGALANLHPRVLAIKIDGATKEYYVWGFRVGFITYGYPNAKVLSVLEQKTIGMIRATISSAPHPSQTFVLHALNDPSFQKQIEQKYTIMKARANKVKQVLNCEKFKEVWTYYPFNSGYFMCLKLLHVKAEPLRLHLLQQYGVGTIALGEHDLRVAFSCVEEKQIEHLFELIHKAVLDLQQK